MADRKGEVMKQAIRFSVIAFFCALAAGNLVAATCNIDLPEQQILKEAKFKILEYSGTYEAVFNFPSFLDYECKSLSSDPNTPMVEWKLPPEVSIHVTFKEVGTGRIVQEDDIRNFAVIYSKNKQVTYWLRKGRIRSFGGIKLLLPFGKHPSYRLLKMDDDELDVGDLQVTSQ